MRRSALAISLAALAFPAWSQQPTERLAGQLYLECRAGDSVPQSEYSVYGKSRCDSFIGGFIAAYNMAVTRSNQTMGICPPSLVAQSDVWLIYRRHFEKRLNQAGGDEVSRMSAGTVLYDALSEFMPCSAAAPSLQRNNKATF